MSNPWPRATLAEVTVNHDGRRVPVRGANRKPGPYPYYGASGIVDHVDGYLFEGLHLLIAEDGENLRTRQTPVAFLADGRFWVNNHAHIVTGNDRADTRYLCYAIAMTDIGGYLTGSAMPKLTQRAMNAIEVTLPPLDVQREIVGVLGSLDDKIEENRRTGRKLEELARAVFKAWFVDFGPVKAKAAGATAFPGMPSETFAVFPDHFTESPLGHVPHGWQVAELGDEFNFQVGFAFKSAQFTDDLSHVRLVRGDNVKEAALEWGSKTRRWSEVTEKISHYHLAAGDVVIGMDGSKLGKNWSRISAVDLPCLLVQRVARFRAIGAAGQSLLWLLISDPTFREFIDAVKTGTSIPHVSGGQLRSFTFVRADDDKILRAFEEMVGPLLKLTDHLKAESAKLAALRDYLLPRLLSGRVRVSGRVDGNL